MRQGINKLLEANLPQVFSETGCYIIWGLISANCTRRIVSWKTHVIILLIHPCLMIALYWHCIDSSSAWYLLPSCPLKSRFLSQSHSVGCYYEKAMLDSSSPMLLQFSLNSAAMQHNCSSPYFLMCGFNKVVYSMSKLLVKAVSKWCHEIPTSVPLSFWQGAVDNYPLGTASDDFCSPAMVAWSNLCFGSLLTSCHVG